MRTLRKGGREGRGGLYIVGNKASCRSESMECGKCNEYVGLMFTLWL